MSRRGAVLSTTQVLSFAPVGAVLASAWPTGSSMSWPATKASVTRVLRLPRSPPAAVTSYWADEPATAAVVSAAIVLLTVKSVSSTFSTSSLKVTRQVRLLALVGDDGVWRSMETTRGAVLSTTKPFSFAPVGAVLASALPAGSSMSWPATKASVTKALRLRQVAPG